MGNPIRTCAGCGQSDDHPRVEVIRSLDQVEEGYHFDCLPHHQRQVIPDTSAAHTGFDATSKGLRGDDVRKAIAAKHLTGKKG